MYTNNRAYLVIVTVWIHTFQKHKERLIGYDLISSQQQRPYLQCKSLEFVLTTFVCMLQFTKKFWYCPIYAKQQQNRYRTEILEWVQICAIYQQILIHKTWLKSQKLIQPQTPKNERPKWCVSCRENKSLPLCMAPVPCACRAAWSLLSSSSFWRRLNSSRSSPIRARRDPRS